MGEELQIKDMHKWFWQVERWKGKNASLWQPFFDKFKDVQVIK